MASHTVQKRRIVVVDDQAEVRELLEEILRGQGREVQCFADGEEALTLLRRGDPEVGLVILDLDFGPRARTGLELLQEIRGFAADLPVVILTGKGTIDAAVAAVKAGATDFLEKDPYLEDKLEVLIEKLDRTLAVVRERDHLALQNRDLQRRVDELQRATADAQRIVGESPALRAVLEKVARVAEIPRPVLILGERGTGKELVALAIHRASPRARGPFVVMNCAAVPETLLESELFGHERGAFTGATERKAGKFEGADGGTLFLDEIGDMSPEFQTKILRVLEYQRFARVAGSREVEVDVRVIAATNADLDAAMEQGTFRRDLYDRLAFEVVRLPPLRERSGDIPLLAEAFLERFAREVGGLRCCRLSAEATAALCGYAYPGNVRELKNVVERAAYMAAGETLEAEDVRAALPGPAAPTPAAAGSFEQQIEALSRGLLTQALAAHGWNQKAAAEALALTYDQFRHLYRKYDLGQLKH